MKPRIAFITARIEPSQTFLFGDITILSKYLDITLHLILPSREPAHIKNFLGEKQSLLRYFPITDAVNILIANLQLFFQSPRKYIFALFKIIKTHGRQPLALAIHIILFPVVMVHVREMKKRNIQHVHGYWANYSSTFAMTAASVLSLNFSMSVHAFDLFEEITALNIKTSLASQVIACSQSACSILRKRLPALDSRKLILCYHGIDLLNFPYFQHNFKKINMELKIISIGRIVGKKGFIVLVKAVNLLANLGWKVNCTICGPVRDRKYYKRLKTEIENSHESARFILPGWLDFDSIVRKINESDIYVQPSIIDKNNGDQDGIPNSMLEAMALGIPVIASEAGGISEVVRNERTGMLLSPDKPSELAQAIIYTLNNPRHTLDRTRQARKYIEKNFDINLRGEIFADILIKNTL